MRTSPAPHLLTDCTSLHLTLPSSPSANLACLSATLRSLAVYLRMAVYPVSVYTVAVYPVNVYTMAVYPVNVYTVAVYPVSVYTVAVYPVSEYTVAVYLAPVISQTLLQ